MTETTKTEQNLDELFKAGAHFGFSKSRRHPSATPLIFGSKNKVDIFDLEKTHVSLENALAFISKLAETKATILFVGGKNEAQGIIKEEAEKIGMPYLAGRWIGGTLTNFPEIRKRIDIMILLLSQKEKGELVKYTKKERILIDRKIEKLQKMFGGIKDMIALPKALFIIDPRFEETALREAKSLKIPVVALCGSDNNITDIDYPISANDSNIASIRFFVEKVAEAYKK
ncbi:MAG: 30S ribosomal protein S2 [Candidatus Zambryskibacteria bacterium RIFCSPLOWO2_01_FULL_39_39]|uniref:Small ribosomal subunit protein uS2 n=1 Tax=Candidatus Zambryskibacteria bacterium RIFCSPLOWO2_01_FULL_39_39 TaxID=1802758 RepID=A0A1G2U1B6_9BACT|nr:MAG: 30S ribosomal protein S2 [Candidatus Zambryskibacteria bacterium RIFCSPHIGHO2_01_FULL_39_63]OHA94835.1 MAG: 30S ribosomal protein S2 [Candidatus Zambryskibacteria bacterium RIFCSPHIGHO2_02_FULL_39_19]OHA98325.1 MAG: 30S ribosomal protein S2 [Candidatus Zambryskibacteria bacterium RIFCSPHIGHO2_12_FULL_39_21]OHB02710.1 MAG: 30S ribosomal protein S2 [Candidatus Zambryskibacteria bacterium RIFCSPLOWO2_01_FULL_39_39]